jgi:hypothetical protein
MNSMNSELLAEAPLRMASLRCAGYRCRKFINSNVGSPLEFIVQVIVPDLFDSVRRSRLHGTDTTSVEPSKQSLELGTAQLINPSLTPGRVNLCSSSLL